MNELNKVYREHVNYELSLLNKENSLLNKELIASKILSFLSTLGQVGEESRCFSFWDSSPTDTETMFDIYQEGFHMILSVGYELKVENIKNFNEIPDNLNLKNLLFKIYEEAILLNSSYRFDDYQNLIDDYLTLGFQLGFDFNDIMNRQYRLIESKSSK